MLSRRYLRRILKSSVVAHLRDGASTEGVLVGVYPDAIVLRHAAILLEDGRRAPLDGDVVIPRAGLSFLQALERS